LRRSQNWLSSDVDRAARLTLSDLGWFAASPLWGQKHRFDRLAITSDLPR
jgi:hypothetical protein